MVATTWLKWPSGFFAVPLNIKCSRKCARPDLPGVSSAAPTLYQIMWVTTGARRSGMTTSCSPFASVKLATGAPVGSAEAVPATRAAAMSAAAPMRGRRVQHCCDAMNFKSAIGGHRSPGSSRRRARAHNTKRICLLRAHRMVARVVGGCGSNHLFLAYAIGLVRRRRLIAPRRFGQSGARRLPGEAAGFGIVFAEYLAEGTAGDTELRGWDLTAGAVRRGPITVVAHAPRARLGSRRNLIRPQRARLGLNHLVWVHAGVALLRRFQFLPLYVGIFWPGRAVGERSIGSFRRRQSSAARRNHQRRALLVVDRIIAALQAEAFHDTAKDFGVDRHVVVVVVVGGAGRGGGREQSRAKQAAYSGARNRPQTEFGRQVRAQNIGHSIPYTPCNSKGIPRSDP